MTIFNFYFNNSTKNLTYAGSRLDDIKLFKEIIENPCAEFNEIEVNKVYGVYHVVLPLRYYDTIKAMAEYGKANKSNYNVLVEIGATDEIKDLFEYCKTYILNTYIDIFFRRLYGFKLGKLSKLKLAKVVASFISNFTKSNAIDYKNDYNVSNDVMDDIELDIFTKDWSKSITSKEIVQELMKSRLFNMKYRERLTYSGMFISVIFMMLWIALLYYVSNK